MRITNFQFSKSQTKRKIWKQYLFVAVVLKVDDATVQFVAWRVAAKGRNTTHLQLRHRDVQVCILNLNSYLVQQCLTEFRLKEAGIAMLCERFDWPDVRYRNECCVAPLKAMCLFPHGLSTPPRWSDLLNKFRLFAFQILGLFREHAKLGVETYGYTLELRANFIRYRVAINASTLVDNGSPLESLIASIDCTKNRTARPEFANYYQQSVYSWHKRKNYLIYQTISTPDGLIAGLHGIV